MPQIRFAKSDDITLIRNDKENNENKLYYIEDKLYIFKETNKIGRLFYNIDNENQIEIGSLDDIYYCNEKLSLDREEIDINSLVKFDEKGEGVLLNSNAIDIDNIKINSFIINEQSIYNIRSIDRNNKTIVAIKIYAQKDLTWIDYYE